MSYFKIAYESDTIDGLGAIQGGATGKGMSATSSTSSDSMVAPPPIQQEDGRSDAFSGLMQPPPVMDGASTGSGYADDRAKQSPPPTMSDMASSLDSEAGMAEPPPVGA
jgi:hypothetical protein